MKGLIAAVALVFSALILSGCSGWRIANAGYEGAKLVELLVKEMLRPSGPAVEPPKPDQKPAETPAE